MSAAVLSTRAPLRWFEGVNPVAKLAACVPATIVLLLTLDPVVSLTSLCLSVLLLAGARAPLGGRVALLIWISAPLAGVTMALYGRGGGTVFFQFGIAQISEGSLAIAVATTLRVLALAVPALALFRSIDLTALADALAQTLRLPARFVLGGLAGLRQLELALDDWRMIDLARRARGLGDDSWLRRWGAGAGALFVLMVRRGGRLAMAMEARGFGPGPRTWTRPAPWGSREWGVIAAGCIVALVSVAVALLAGGIRFAWS